MLSGIRVARIAVATVVSAAAGSAAWWFGLAARMWPAHPALVACGITVLVSAAVTMLATRWKSA